MRLFKYLHPDRTDVLRDSSLRFSSPKVLNDPFELKPHISAVVSQDRLPQDVDRLLPGELAKSYKNLSPLRRALTSEDVYRSFMQSLGVKDMTVALLRLLDPMVCKAVEQKMEELVGILCLTESPTSLLMWAHYADSHHGLVLEFDPESPFFNQRLGPEDDFRHLRRVVYQEERPTVILTEMEDFSPFLTKGLDWSYEAEWRMLMPLSSASVTTKGDGPMAIHLFAFPKSMVRSVIYGTQRYLWVPYG